MRPTHEKKNNVKCQFLTFVTSDKSPQQPLNHPNLERQANSRNADKWKGVFIMPFLKATVRFDLEKVTVHSTLKAAIKQVILKIKELLLIIDVLLYIAIE